MSHRDAAGPEPEAAWRQRVRARAELPQLTPRAVVTGALIGVVTGVSNLYVGLKLGWGLGVVITASILGWAAWQAGRALGLSRREPSVLEAAAMASTASAAGYSTGTTLVSAIAAWLLVTGHHLPLWQLMAWIASVSTLGLGGALLLRHRLLHVEQLPFPTGAAAAETLESLARRRGPEHRRARALLWALAVGLAVKGIVGVLPLLGGPALPKAIPDAALATGVPVLSALVTYGFALELSLLLPAAGVLVGWRIGWSLLLGAAVCYAVLAPPLIADGTLAGPAYAQVISWSVWPGATMMSVASLASLLAARGSWRRIWSWGDGGHDASAVPRMWIELGLVAAATGCVVLQILLFDVPVWIAVLAVVLALLLAMVAARVTGETDITPMGPLAKVTQLAFGPLLPGRPMPNLMVASVSAGAAVSAADLLTDLKAGWALGLPPRRQVLAQLVGVAVGVGVVVPIFRYVLVPDASVLGTAQWPAPAAKVWWSISKLVGGGLHALPPHAATAIGIAGAIAVVLVLAERLLPAARPWIPSPTGLGLAFVLPASNALSFFIGGAVAAWLTRKRPDAIATHAIPIAAGLIAGESLMGVAESLLSLPA